MPFARVLILLMCCLLTPLASAIGLDPYQDWMTADSPHFRVHYIAAQRAQAERVSAAAERAYPRITKALNWEPRGRTEIVMIDQSDWANGFSTPLPFSMVGLYMAPPDDGELLDNSDWLEMLLLHEFTHTVQLDKVRGFPGVLQKIFGRGTFWFPNVFQPTWSVEGLAVYNESDPATGRGRLRGPAFEAWLRAESQRGFLSLRELNADGRALPTSKAYLYGAYFQEYLVRTYGPTALAQMVERYSGNPPFYPRMDSSLRPFTDRSLAEVWPEFLADLQQQVKQRNAPLLDVPEAAGSPVGETLFDIGSVATLPDGNTLAVLDDGLGETQLVRIAPDGKQKVLTQINSGTRIDVAPDGKVLLAQPDICNWRYLAYDLYRLDPDGSQHKLTSCARLRHAVQAGDSIVALQQAAGLTRAVVLDAQGKQQRVLWTPPADTVLVDLAASPDGKRVSVVSKRGADWRVQQFELAQPDAAPNLLFTYNAPLYNLRDGAAGLEFIASRDGIYNVWRLQDGALVRVTHAHTGVVAQGGTQADGSLTLAVVAPGGYQLRRMPATSAQQRVALDGSPMVAIPAEPPATGAPGPLLGEGSAYQAWKSVYPRSWFPLVGADQGLTSYGASTFGSDAAGWHQYVASLQYETSQHEAIGSFEYLFLEQHLFSFSRDLTPRAWSGDKDDGNVIAYDRNTRAQWISTLPWPKFEWRLTGGIGAGIDTVDRVDPQGLFVAPPKDQRVAAALIDYDSGNSNWWSEGNNRGQHATLLYENYKVFQREPDDYDGSVLRLNWRGYVPLGRSVFAVRYTEALAQGRTEPFQVGGAFDPQLQLGVLLNSRDLSLRGYRGNEPGLYGGSARVASFEFRTPLADIDRHATTPAVGINRLSGAVFFDIGGAWDEGHSPVDGYHRGVGVELLGETKLMYVMGLQIRLGVAQGLDEPKATRGYASVGHSF